MLYKLHKTTDKFDRIEPLPFKDFSSFAHLEKDLETLIASNILDVLFEDSGYMPIFQERTYQAEADIYALNEAGDLIIFELKRSYASNDAVHQALRYAQDAGQWSYAKLNNKFHSYSNSNLDLALAHKDAFDLEHKLEPKEINKKQHLIIIGSAADDSLINAVAYWSNQGLSIDFLPYRIYQIDGNPYFEFFSPPFDRHKNPGTIKGVLFDTNRSYDEDAIWYMLENNCVAAFGEAQRFVELIYPGDIVFLSHKWQGIVAAGRVKKGPIKKPNSDTSYREIDFLTPIQARTKSIKALPFNGVSLITGKSFFWARTIKVPYLSKEEADNLVSNLIDYLTSASAD